jgi:hypothetical protein
MPCAACGSTLRTMSRALLVVAAVAATTRPAHADDAPPEVSTKRRLAAIGAAIVPGVVVHGSGSWVLRERRTATRLAITGWIGLGAMAVGGAAVGITGANEYMVVWGVPVIIAGAGLAIPTWFADIWHAAGGPKVRGEAHAASPWMLELGTTYLHDAYRERALVRTAGRIELGRVGLGAATLVDAEGRASTGEVETRVRLVGAPAHGRAVGDGSRLYVRAAVRRHADDDDRVTIATGEAEVGTRYDLQRLDRNLAGNFVEISLGMGMQRVRYAGEVTDYDSLFLGRFGWGLYLGQHSELITFYDHRRDSLAGGIAAGRAAGFVGSVGASLDLRLGGPFAFAGELEIGNAWVVTAGLRYHGGTR